ncbi:MAG: hypothetical protein GY757_30775, partial [bacterium]|nr:hypothetical protein [bacterium]
MRKKKPVVMSNVNQNSWYASNQRGSDSHPWDNEFIPPDIIVEVAPDFNCSQAADDQVNSYRPDDRIVEISPIIVETSPDL